MRVATTYSAFKARLRKFKKKSGWVTKIETKAARWMARRRAMRTYVAGATWPFAVSLAVTVAILARGSPSRMPQLVLSLQALYTAMRWGDAMFRRYARWQRFERRRPR